MQVFDMVCDVCEQSVSSKVVEGRSVPIVAYIVVGQAPGYKGPPIDYNAPGIKLPAILRELLAQSPSRREYCVEHFAQAFGLALTEAGEKP